MSASAAKRRAAPGAPALDNVIVVLSHTTEPRNLGAAARALKTMGLRRLRLVAPRDPLGAEARAVAHGAEEILEQAELFTDVRAAVADLPIVAGTTCRRRQLRKHALLPPRQLCADLARHARSGPVALLFGTERVGLSNDELDMCRYLSTIDMAQPQPSLNLAQAVMLYAWEMRSACLADEAALAAPRVEPAAAARARVHHPHRGTRLPTQFELDMMHAHLGEAMAAVGYSAAEQRKFLTYLRHLHMRAGIVDWEVQIFHLLARRILEQTGKPAFKGV